MAKYMIIDGMGRLDQEKNITTVINSVGIHVPTLCYYSDLSIYGACRMCMVEDERGSLIASCSTPQTRHGHQNKHAKAAASQKDDPGTASGVSLQGLHRL